MKNFEIRDRLQALTAEERRITNEILDLLLLAMERHSWLEFGFSSLYDWLNRGFGYSPAAAMRRIEAARLLQVVPEAKEKLESGELSLTTLSKVQGAIRAQEKEGTVTIEQKQEALKAVENKSVPEAERKLAELFPATKSSVHQERRVTLDENTTRHSLNLSAEASANLQRAKELFSHKFPHATDAQIIAFALEFLLEKKDPLRLPAASAAETTSAAKRTRTVLQKHQGECAYIDPKTGRKCTSRYQIQIDHIKPKALGGSNAPENLRPLCRQHNLFEARRQLGPAKMAKFWRSG